MLGATTARRNAAHGEHVIEVGTVGQGEDEIERLAAEVAHGQALAAWDMAVSMSRAGAGLDNNMAERFFATLKPELASAPPWPTRASAHRAIFAWIEVFHNRQRAHSAHCYPQPRRLGGAGIVVARPRRLAISRPHRRGKGSLTAYIRALFRA